MRWAAPALLLLAGCHHSIAPGQGNTPGDRLERAATAAGLVSDITHVDPVGLYARDADRVCVVGDGHGGYRFGALVALDERHGCAAAGTTTAAHGLLRVRLGEDCRFEATLDGDRVALPATVPSACDRFCRGGASLAALTAERLSPASAEAVALRDGRGRPLCGA